ncbi:MAG: 4Fe-4S dicluster domain-containing protein [Acidobacteriota bacterium]|jgi:Fe-S-cluster-containing dehydrogenase component
MIISRKKFLKIAGISALVATGEKLGDSFSEAGEAPGTETQQRLAMVIDLRKCAREKGCTQCIDACHQAHNVPEIEDKNHKIQWIWKDEFKHAFPSTHGSYLAKKVEELPVLLLCNHCDNPPCVRVCPTKATWKRENDGIVVMDWHRCIGCRYCMAACPYGSRSFNWKDPRPDIDDVNVDFPTRTKGVVEKCNFCDERRVDKLLPACVEACPQNAMLFGDLNEAGSEIRQLLASEFSIRRKPELGTNPEVYYIV